MQIELNLDEKHSILESGIGDELLEMATTNSNILSLKELERLDELYVIMGFAECEFKPNSFPKTIIPKKIVDGESKEMGIRQIESLHSILGRIRWCVEMEKECVIPYEIIQFAYPKDVGDYEIICKDSGGIDLVRVKALLTILKKLKKKISKKYYSFMIISHKIIQLAFPKESSEICFDDFEMYWTLPNQKISKGQKKDKGKILKKRKNEDKQELKINTSNEMYEKSLNNLRMEFIRLSNNEVLKGKFSVEIHRDNTHIEFIKELANKGYEMSKSDDFYIFSWYHAKGREEESFTLFSEERELELKVQ